MDWLWEQWDELIKAHEAIQDAAFETWRIHLAAGKDAKAAECMRLYLFMSNTIWKLEEIRSNMRKKFANAPATLEEAHAEAASQN